LNIKTIINGFFFGNCYLVWDEDKNCVVIDPGDEEELVEHAIREHGLTPKLIVGTHASVVTIGAVDYLREALGAPFALHAEESRTLEYLPTIARYFGLPVIRIPDVDRWLKSGEEIKAGGVVLEVLHTPGHTPGSICLLGNGMVITGDTLLAGSYGRTDWKGGSEESIIRSISKNLFVLDEATQVYPGHGPMTTIGEEKKSNWVVYRKGVARK